MAGSYSIQGPFRTSRSSRNSRTPPPPRGSPLGRSLDPHPLCELREACPSYRRGHGPERDSGLSRVTQHVPSSYPRNQEQEKAARALPWRPQPFSLACCCPLGGRGGGEKVNVRLGVPIRPGQAWPTRSLTCSGSHTPLSVHLGAHRPAPGLEPPSRPGRCMLP